MEQAGPVKKVELFKDSFGYPSGCGIVEFSTARDASNAVAALHQSAFKGRIITVKLDDSNSAYKKKLTSPVITADNQIQVTNMPPSVTWQQLRDVCKEFGPVIRGEVLLDSSRRSKGVGIVVFRELDDARCAVRSLHGAIFNDRHINAYLMGE